MSDDPFNPEQAAASDIFSASSMGLGRPPAPPPPADAVEPRPAPPAQAEPEPDGFDDAPLLKPKEREQEDPDITPMIDITFLLLIFFIVASTPDQQTAIELPEAQHGVPVSQLTSVVFTIGDGGLDLAPVYEADGKIDEFLLSSDEDERDTQIEEAIRTGFDENKTDVVIKADKSVAFRQVDKVVRAASRVEGVKLHLAVLETE